MSEATNSNRNRLDHLKQLNGLEIVEVRFLCDIFLKIRGVVMDFTAASIELRLLCIDFEFPIPFPPLRLLREIF